MQNNLRAMEFNCTPFMVIYKIVTITLMTVLLLKSVKKTGNMLHYLQVRHVTILQVHSINYHNGNF